jgi:hypothetical protein
MAKGHYVAPPVKGELVDPVWDNLRGDPRFERIYARAVAKQQLDRKKVLALGLF